MAATACQLRSSARLRSSLRRSVDVSKSAKLIKQFISQLTGFQADETFALSRKAEQDLVNRGIQLRPYQRAGIHWLTWLQQNHLHGVLADDMGLGKTLQSIAAMRQAYEETGSREHSLVVAPKSVVPHWSARSTASILRPRLISFMVLSGRSFQDNGPNHLHFDVRYRGTGY